MANQPDPLYDLREDDPARFVARDGDLCDYVLVRDDEDGTPSAEPIVLPL